MQTVAAVAGPPAQVCSLGLHNIRVRTPTGFKRVVFAIPSKWTNFKVRLSFQQEFERPREVLEEAAKSRADRKLLILAGSKLCVDAPADACC